MSKIRAGYTRRKNGSLQRQFTVNGKRYTVYGNTYKECEAKERSKRDELTLGLIGSDITLDEYYDIWKNRRMGTIKPSTHRNDESIYINNIKDRLGNKKLRDITRNDVFKLQSSLTAKGLNASTNNLVLVVLKCIMKSAVMDDIIIKSPCNGVKQLRSSEPEARNTVHRALTEEELSVFFEHATNSMYYNLLRFMLMTGVRAGEACALQWKDVDWDNGVLHITKTFSLTQNGYIVNSPKTKTSKRDIPINKPIREILHDQSHLGIGLGFPTNKNNFVFNNRRGEFIRPCTANNAINSALSNCARAGKPIEKFSSHAFRDTFATRAIEAGMKPETLQGILGHADISLTMNLYYHLSEEKKREEMNLIEYPQK